MLNSGDGSRVGKRRSVRLSLTGLVKYMTGSQSQQRKTLLDYKYPDAEGKAQRDYYTDARSIIAKYHRNGHAPDWLTRQADKLAQLAALETGQRKTKLSNNARAVRSYAKHFAVKSFEVLQSPKLSLGFAGVAVSVYPDLYVVEGKKEKLIRLDFHKNPPADEAVKISSQALFEAAEQAGLGLTSSCVLYFDLSSGTIHKGARMGSRMRNEIEAACQNIAAIWNTL